MMTDPIADMLTRIRNANQMRNATVSMPSSNLKAEIAKLLLEEGYIENYEVSGEVKKELTITLKYVENERVITGLKRISKPGLRVQASVEKLP
jgi:small subunit ribosomal protein S8